MRGKAWLAAVGGNGGLSLRRRSQALACLDAGSWQRGQWEDAYFVEALQQLGHTVACSAAARAFAVERPLQPLQTIQPLHGGADDGGPCGLHKAYNYLAPDHLGRLLATVEEEYTRR